MNIVSLMAGSDEAFVASGFRYPKNLVEVSGRPLVEHVVENFAELHAAPETRSTFLVKDHELQSFHTDDVLRLLVGGANVIPVQEPTGGAACTALLAIESINNDEELLVCNGDLIVDLDIREVLASFRERQLDGGIVVFDAVHPRWSYVKLDAVGLVVETAEKRPISRMATVGIYYFRRGSDFVTAAFESIRKGADVGGSFYVCPVYNELILAQKRIGVFETTRLMYHSLADPQGVSDYESHLHDKEAS
ncbi:glycosyltransferase family 2 protein [Nocardioides sp. cx-173]|uniref:glycosyltransferase family 2 protein n=1 Tax=Nocardioides sp. cx-173 TaxID=2898796 RepID=UPI001E441E55|nr:glycosyltransferase family 2 protein [Nocardioides sp. cx-173]MCD4526933.1 glycosyltransferase family 2 protein [Nocardioides sp. cx-173]UGB41279.1 glycosyltransferase family 2 protein [Nocardioides sp. cx-173]